MKIQRPTLFLPFSCLRLFLSLHLIWLVSFVFISVSLFSLSVCPYISLSISIVCLYIWTNRGQHWKGNLICSKTWKWLGKHVQLSSGAIYIIYKLIEWSIYTLMQNGTVFAIVCHFGAITFNFLLVRLIRCSIHWE